MAQRTSLGGSEKLRRKTQKIQQRKLFILVGEGNITEKEYFNIFQKSSNCRDYAPGHHGGSPQYLVKEMNQRKKEHSPAGKSSPTEYWIILDKEDENKPRDLSCLIEWVQKDKNHHLALTYPQFENWLLLHFQSGMSSNNPIQDMQKFIPGYGKQNKHIGNAITREMVISAMEKAKKIGIEITDRPKTLNDINGNSSYYTGLPHLICELLKG